MPCMPGRAWWRLALFPALAALLIPVSIWAEPDQPLEGYVTATHLPDTFDVNGQAVELQPSTTFGLQGERVGSSDSSLRSELQTGAYVSVRGDWDAKAHRLRATSILFRDHWNTHLSGIGVIDRLLEPGSEPLLEADGYRIRITPATQTAFHGALKTLADVVPGTWIRFEGARDKSGILTADRADLFPPKPAEYKAAAGLEFYDIPFRPAGSKDAVRTGTHPMDLDMEGGHIKLTFWGGWRLIPADREVQDRVQRIGSALVPGWQKQLASGDPLRIHFRFYAVDAPKMRMEFATGQGLVLIPVHLAERLKSDDQLAAVLADGIAGVMQRQTARVIGNNRAFLGGEGAAMAAAQFVPGLDLAYWVGASVAQNKIQNALREERLRISLALMADAGYDPWQAPEAWRLAVAKRLPADASTLKYPVISGYQLGILNLQYRLGATSQARR
jgi:hypothetical protein